MLILVSKIRKKGWASPDLNNKIASLEGKGTAVQPPGPPSSIHDLAQLVSKDRMEAPQSSVHRFGTAKGKKR
jgi:hypothetical protein